MEDRAIHAEAEGRVPPRASAETRCDVCGGEAVLAARFLPTQFLECPGCSFIFQASQPTLGPGDCYDARYFVEYDGHGAYVEAEAARAYEAAVRLGLVHRYVTGGRLLEIGPAAGYFLDAAQRAGFSATGVEPSVEMCSFARERFGVNVIAGAIEEVTLQRSSFAAICGWHVLEHIPEPVVVLGQLRELLSKDGVLFIEVPNIGSKRASRERGRWAPLDPEHHINQFQATSLAAALRVAGYEVVSLTTVPWSQYRRFPRSLLSHAKEAVSVRGWPLGPHPWWHELLRVVARPADDSR